MGRCAEKELMELITIMFNCRRQLTSFDSFLSSVVFMSQSDCVVSLLPAPGFTVYTSRFNAADLSGDESQEVVTHPAAS